MSKQSSLHTTFHVHVRRGDPRYIPEYLRINNRTKGVESLTNTDEQTDEYDDSQRKRTRAQESDDDGREKEDNAAQELLSDVASPTKSQRTVTDFSQLNEENSAEELESADDLESLLPDNIDSSDKDESADGDGPLGEGGEDFDEDDLVALYGNDSQESKESAANAESEDATGLDSSAESEDLAAPTNSNPSDESVEPSDSTSTPIPPVSPIPLAKPIPTPMVDDGTRDASTLNSYKDLEIVMDPLPPLITPITWKSKTNVTTEFNMSYYTENEQFITDLSSLHVPNNIKRSQSPYEIEYLTTLIKQTTVNAFVTSGIQMMRYKEVPSQTEPSLMSIPNETLDKLRQAYDNALLNDQLYAKGTERVRSYDCTDGRLTHNPYLVHHKVIRGLQMLQNSYVRRTVSGIFESLGKDESNWCIQVLPVRSMSRDTAYTSQPFIHTGAQSRSLVAPNLRQSVYANGGMMLRAYTNLSDSDNLTLTFLLGTHMYGPIFTSSISKRETKDLSNSTVIAMELYNACSPSKKNKNSFTSLSSNNISTRKQFKLQPGETVLFDETIGRSNIVIERKSTNPMDRSRVLEFAWRIAPRGSAPIHELMAQSDLYTPPDSKFYAPVDYTLGWIVSPIIPPQEHRDKLIKRILLSYQKWIYASLDISSLPIKKGNQLSILDLYFHSNSRYASRDDSPEYIPYTEFELNDRNGTSSSFDLQSYDNIDSFTRDI